jgi:hypothetical protein
MLDPSLRLKLASTHALLDVDIVAADAVEAPERESWEMPYEIVQYASGRVREIVYGEASLGQELMLRQTMKSDPQSSACERYLVPLRVGSRCYVWVANLNATEYRCDPDISPFASTQEELRSLARELEARAHMTERDWDELLAPLTALAKQVAGVTAQGCRKLLQVEPGQAVDLRQAFYAPSTCLSWASDFPEQASWFVVEDIRSKQPELLAWARSEGGSTSAWRVSLDRLAHGALSLNPTAITPIDCKALAKQLDYPSFRLCRNH